MTVAGYTADPDDEWSCGYYDGLRAAEADYRLTTPDRLAAAKRGAMSIEQAMRDDEMGAALERVRALVSDFNANGNGCELGDPTADTWHKAANLLLDALRGQP